VPEQVKAAKPTAGRAIESDAADTPAKRAKEGEAPVSPTDQKEASDPSRATKVENRTEEAAKPAPQSSKSYVTTPGEGATPASPTTPNAGTPPSQAKTRRDGSESKPGVVVDKDNKTS
jgi:NADH-quinone oxidoreductase subunit E